MLGDGLDAPEPGRDAARPASLKTYVFEQPLLARAGSTCSPRVPLFKDKRVRQALNYATDRDAARARDRRRGVHAWGAPFPKGLLGGQRTFQPYTYDPDKAQGAAGRGRASPKPCGRRSGCRPTAASRARRRSCSSSGRAVGINVKLAARPTPTRSTELTIKNKCDAWISTYYAIYPTAIDLDQPVLRDRRLGQLHELLEPAGRRADGSRRGARPTRTRATRCSRRSRQIVGDDAAARLPRERQLDDGPRPRPVQNFNYSGVYGTYYDRLWARVARPPAAAGRSAPSWSASPCSALVVVFALAAPLFGDPYAISADGLGRDGPAARRRSARAPRSAPTSSAATCSRAPPTARARASRSRSSRTSRRSALGAIVGRRRRLLPRLGRARPDAHHRHLPVASRP